ncbi:FAD-dependent oxidoreductase [Nocardioides sp. URHA0020]|uniref:FAD-dependent oxidoreductase n=1 Tax=Nocardioides sp. URHA0020 TaxID=1380392 RepID=UPI00048BC1E6|nr:FAD-dependent oxidoreductase [Nocardioides sp. URHA0020]
MTDPSPGSRRVAVVGSGVAGLTAAYFASRSASVTLYEADDRLGGHADTHQVGDLAIDTGFIVHNERTYPVLLRIFRELGVATQPSEMSLSVRDDATGLEWAGALGRTGLFPDRSNLSRPAYLRMLAEVPRFHRRARRLMDGEGPDQTLSAFLDAGRFTPYFRRHFMEPLVASVWSCDPAVALDYPARYLFSFLDHHGMLGIFGSPEWRTVTGGSRTYVERVAARIDDIRTETKVTSILESADGVEVTDGNGVVTTYDAVVIATHPAQALTMLAAPTAAQREVLAALRYSPNVATLHTDVSVLPRAVGARASWNFRRPVEATGHVMVTYDLTRLQRLPTDTHYLVTLGGEDLIDPSTVIDRMEYEHPLYTPQSVAAQSRLGEIDTDRIAFAGAYHGWGFHEDGARSGLAAAERLGLHGGKPQPHTSPVTPAIYATTIRHTRRTPWKRSFTHRSHTWLVDVDALPEHGLLSPVLGSFEARDHLGAPDRSIRHNVAAFLQQEGIELGDGQVLMAAQPRAWGFCFNPITVFWVRPAAGAPCAVVEVHNTYGDRHAYLVHPDERGRATTAKQMYVSPFHGTDGTYRLAVPVPGDELLISVDLTTDDGAAFNASLTGHRSDDGAVRAAPAALRGALLIRVHGIWLWLRRLPVRPRPDHHHQEGVR